MVTIIFMVTFQYSNIHDPTFQPQLKHKMHHILVINTHNTHHLTSPPPFFLYKITGQNVNTT